MSAPFLLKIASNCFYPALCLYSPILPSFPLTKMMACVFHLSKNPMNTWGKQLEKCFSNMFIETKLIERKGYEKSSLLYIFVLGFLFSSLA